MKYRNQVLGLLGAVVLLAGTDATSAAPTSGCPTGLPGPRLVQIQGPTGKYCIDATEVTQAQYQAFVDVHQGQSPIQAPECEWNKELVPRVDETGGEMPFGSCPPGYYDPANLGGRSVVCVDWCDAAAFCAWAGKRLCGALSGREPTREVRRAFAETEWRYACTNGGTTAYPYGSDYIPKRCNYRPVTSAGSSSSENSACVGTKAPFSEIRNLAGSVEEWTALCEGGVCSIEGFSSGQGACSGGITPNGIVSATIGFRCCADLEGAR